MMMMALVAALVLVVVFPSCWMQQVDACNNLNDQPQLHLHRVAVLTVCVAHDFETACFCLVMTLQHCDTLLSLLLLHASCGLL